jgi:hypothetical protein
MPRNKIKMTSEGIGRCLVKLRLYVHTDVRILFIGFHSSRSGSLLMYQSSKYIF